MHDGLGVFEASSNLTPISLGASEKSRLTRLQEWEASTQGIVPFH